MSAMDIEQAIAQLEERMRRRTRRWLIGGVVLVGLFVPGVMLAASVTVPNVFTSGTLIKSADVNANFSTLATEATRVSNIVQGPGDNSNTNKVVGLGAPVAANDGASKGYVDAALMGAGAGSITLIGTTTCPAGWTPALSGTPHFFGGSATVPFAAYACFNGASLNTTYNWAASTGSCVICVK